MPDRLTTHTLTHARRRSAVLLRLLRLPDTFDGPDPPPLETTHTHSPLRRPRLAPSIPKKLASHAPIAMNKYSTSCWPTRPLVALALALLARGIALPFPPGLGAPLPPLQLLPPLPPLPPLSTLAAPMALGIGAYNIDIIELLVPLVDSRNGTAFHG